MTGKSLSEGRCAAVCLFVVERSAAIGEGQPHFGMLAHITEGWGAALTTFALDGTLQIPHRSRLYFTWNGDQTCAVSRCRGRCRACLARRARNVSRATEMPHSRFSSTAAAVVNMNSRAAVIGALTLASLSHVGAFTLTMAGMDTNAQKLKLWDAPVSNNGARCRLGFPL